jgi:phage baseplate assembly protein W
MSEVDFPFHVDAEGRTATTSEEEHVRDMIEQVLFTSPGERVNRPTFGSGLLQLAFAPNNDALAAATQVTVQGNLQLWLADRIHVQNVDVSHEESTLRVTVRYVLRLTQQSRVAEFVKAL